VIGVRGGAVEQKLKTHVGDISSFRARDIDKLRGVEKIEGDLVIDAAGYGHRSDLGLVATLEALSSLKEVTGKIVIRGLPLESLKGLENLTRVGGELLIQNLDIKDLKPLANLKQAGALDVGHCEGLVDMKGLEGLERVDGMFRIHSNAERRRGHVVGLESLAGLENLEHVGELRVMGNANLRTMAGLDGLASVDGNVLVHGNARLRDLAGLRGLSEIPGTLWLSGNNHYQSSLSDLRDLANLERVGGNVQIEGHKALDDLAGLEKLAEIGRDLKLSLNGAELDVSALGSLRRVGGDIDGYHQKVRGLDAWTSIDRVEGDIRFAIGTPSAEVDRLQARLHEAKEARTFRGDFESFRAKDLDKLRGIETIEGDLVIDASGYSHRSDLGLVETLEVLASLREVTGNIVIRGLPLEDLKGLEGLTSVGGELRIENLDIDSLKPLSQLKKAGALDIGGCAGLTDLNL